ncbi:MAG: aminopeptidase P family protein, partial [Firmicutes bacterium]|nr:aminopeptidase P family protein [Bacillota bacterium]
RHFYYLTGVDRERIIAVLTKTDGKENAVLYIEPFDETKAKWVGPVLLENEAKEISGIEDIKYISDFEDDMKALSADIKKIYIDCERKDLSEDKMPEGIRKYFSSQEFGDLFEIISSFRTIKEDWEMERIEKAIDITVDAIKEMMKNIRPGMAEYEAEAYYDFVLTKNGVTDKAFKTIAASGKNGCILHYQKNNCIMNDGDLILVDAGAQYKWYNGDITRTFPINGKFTDKQKEIYNIVLGGQKMVIDMVKEGVEYPSLNEALKDYYFDELSKIGLISTKEDVSKYYNHDVSHFLGAETHDVGDRKQVLKEGMVITVEPGLYIEELGIGIRIEDDVLVTKDGCRVLTAAMPKTVEDIERFMAEK